jgi:hypothetical protein
MYNNPARLAGVVLRNLFSGQRHNFVIIQVVNDSRGSNMGIFDALFDAQHSTITNGNSC